MVKSMGIIANEMDNVCTVVTEVKMNSLVQCKYSRKSKGKINIYARSDIPIFHKIAVKDIPMGADIIKYGEIIGKAKKSIFTGEHVHIQNVDSKRVQGDMM